MENLENIKEAVENTSNSYRAIAKEFGTNHTQIKKFVEKYSWDVSHRVSKIPSIPAPHIRILGNVAVRKIEELKRELGDNYSSVDEPLIVMYAKNYERYLELEATLQEKGVLAFSIKTGSEYMSPTFTASLAVQKNLVTIANQLGLSIASRKKLGLRFDIPGQEQGSLFDFAKEFSNDGELDDI